MRKIAITTSLALLLCSVSLNSAMAFDDVKGSQSQAIQELQQRGVVSGMDEAHFAPEADLSYAQAVTMLVNGFDLNLDTIRFIKKPAASDMYKNVNDDAWYAEALVNGYYNDVQLPENVNPGDAITREEFAALLMKTLETKGNLPMIKITSVAIKDNAQLKPELQGAVQRMLHYKIASLNKDGRFHPQAAISRGEAAEWLARSLKLMDEKAASNTTPAS
ncbi:S-layer homology domain-containing protein [Paenibacillus sp. Z6-24]